MTKVIFVAIWFSPIYPAVLFLSALGLFITYYVDRFGLMRSWARSPKAGTTIARFVRQYMIPLAVCINAVVAAYTWSGFPYDHLCETAQNTTSTYVGQWNIRVSGDNSGNTQIVTVGTNATIYQHCHQRIAGLEGRPFPPSPTLQPRAREWMTTPQELVVEIFGWTSLAVVAWVSWYILYCLVRHLEQSFRASYQPSGEDQHIPFSTVEGITTYIPQVPSQLYPYPLLGCRADKLDPDLFEFHDPDRPHSYYDLTRDAEDVVGKERLELHHVFSTVSHWPPGDTVARAPAQAGRNGESSGSTTSMGSGASAFGGRP